MNVAGRRRNRAVAILMAGVFAAGVAGAADLARLLPGLEQESLLQRFERRDARPAPNLLVVAVDDKTFSDLQMQWPFPRRWHARAIDRLRRDGARVIVYDVQFTEQTTARDDNELIDAIDRAHDIVLATAETDEHGGTNVLGGAAALKSIGAKAAASNLPEGRGGVLQHVEYDHGGLPTLATVAARLVRHPPARSSFPQAGAWIDFHGPPGTVDSVSFSDLVAGRVDPARVRGRIVVVGAGAPARRRRCRTCTPRRRATGSCRGRRSRPTRSTASSAAIRCAARRRGPAFSSSSRSASCRRWSACACAHWWRPR
jgi:CHASE2 domain-containing sensor protein